MEQFKNRGYDIRFLGARQFADGKYLVKEITDIVRLAIEKLSIRDKDEALYRLFSERYLFAVAKRR